MSATKKGCGEVGCDPAACKLCTPPGIPEARQPPSEDSGYLPETTQDYCRTVGQGPEPRRPLTQGGDVSKRTRWAVWVWCADVPMSPRRPWKLVGKVWVKSHQAAKRKFSDRYDPRLLMATRIFPPPKLPHSYLLNPESADA